MSTDFKTNDLPPDIVADGDALIASILTGRPLDPVITRRIQERATRITNEVYRKHGFLDVAVPAIRELRDS